LNSRNGRIFVEGEYWNAISDARSKKAEEAEIAAVKGLTIKLTRKPHRKTRHAIKSAWFCFADREVRMNER